MPSSKTTSGVRSNSSSTGDRDGAAQSFAAELAEWTQAVADIPPPAEAMQATRAAIGQDEADSWPPFTGSDDLEEAVAAFIERRDGLRYDGRREIVITCGGGDAMVDALFRLTDPGDEEILTDPPTLA